MSDNLPVTEANGQTPTQRPPFNEVSVLFPLLTIYTAAYMALMFVDFALKSALELPEGIMPVYIALLGAYAADKEIRRWIGTPEPPRKGSLFVYLWLLFFLTAYIIYSFRPDYSLPGNLLPVCLQVLGIFFGSKASKYVWETRQADNGKRPAHRNPRGEGGTTDDGWRQAKIMDMIKASGQVTRRNVMEKLGVSDSTANRMLQIMEAKKLVRRMGEGRGIYYIIGS